MAGGALFQDIAPTVSTVLSVFIAMAEILAVAYLLGIGAAVMVTIVTLSYTALCWRRAHETNKRRPDQ